MTERRRHQQAFGYLSRERGSVTLGQFNPNRDLQLANSRITSLVLLASAGIFLLGLALSMLTGQAVSVPVSVDASPFAGVRVIDSQGEEVLEGNTPFVAALAPGEYSFQFTYGSRTVTKPVHVQSDRTHLVRHQFWDDDEVESLVGRFLKKGDD